MRSATILATSDCHLGYVTKDDFRKTLLKFENRQLNANIEFVSNLIFFSHWSKT